MKITSAMPKKPNTPRRYVSWWSRNASGVSPREEPPQGLAAGEPLRSVLGVAEGLPGDRKAVDPRLELRGHAEVVHRRPDHPDVGDKELVESRLSRG
jgi:hypothetical protein